MLKKVFWFRNSSPDRKYETLQQMCEKPLATYTRRELAMRNGQDRAEIWCGYKGIIYDVSKSKLWRNGMHYEHWAGQDLTDELSRAPHTERVFEKFAIVGTLSD